METTPIQNLNTLLNTLEVVEKGAEISAFSLADGFIVVRVTGWGDTPDFAVVSGNGESSVVYLDDFYFTKPIRGLRNDHLRNLAKAEVLGQIGTPISTDEAVASLVEGTGFSVMPVEEGEEICFMHFSLMGAMEWQVVLCNVAGLKPVTTPENMAKMLSKGVPGFRLPNGAAAVGGSQDGRVLGLKAILVDALRAGGLKLVPVKKGRKISR